MKGLYPTTMWRFLKLFQIYFWNSTSRCNAFSSKLGKWVKCQKPKSVDAGMLDCAEGGSCLSMLPPSNKRGAQQTSWNNMTIKTIMNPATEDGRNRQAFNHPPQGNETLAVWQRGSVDTGYLSRKRLWLVLLLSVRVTGGYEEDDHHRRG